MFAGQKFCYWSCWLPRNRNDVYRFAMRHISDVNKTAIDWFDWRQSYRWSLKHFGNVTAYTEMTSASLLVVVLLKLHGVAVVVRDWPATDPRSSHSRIKLISLQYLQHESRDTQTCSCIVDSVLCYHQHCTHRPKCSPGVNFKEPRGQCTISLALASKVVLSVILSWSLHCFSTFIQ